MSKQEVERERDGLTDEALRQAAGEEREALVFVCGECWHTLTVMLQSRQYGVDRTHLRQQAYGQGWSRHDGNYLCPVCTTRRYQQNGHDVVVAPSKRGGTK